MNRSIIGLIFLAVLVTNLFSVEIEGFREFKWGDAPSEKFSTSQITRGNKKRIMGLLVNENKTIGDVRMSSIGYDFFDNKLFSVSLLNNQGGFSAFLSLINTFKAKYGDVNSHDRLGHEYNWSSDKGYISIEYNSIRNLTFIMISSKKISAESEEYEKQLAKEAVKDI